MKMVQFMLEHNLYQLRRAGRLFSFDFALGKRGFASELSARTSFYPSGSLWKNVKRVLRRFVWAAPAFSGVKAKKLLAT
jgi:hypothetical protein